MTVHPAAVDGGYLLVICRANVARSALLAGFLADRLAARGRGDLRVASAGFEAASGMTATAEAVLVAAEMDVDVSGHWSVPMTTELVARAALVLTMTEAQRDAVERLPGSRVATTFTVPEIARLLAAVDPVEATDWAGLARAAHRARPLVVAPAQPEDVPDPAGQPAKHYRVLAERLAAMATTIADAVVADDRTLILDP